MSPVSRALSGPNLTFDLTRQIAELRADESYSRTGRAGRTLVKAGALRLVLVVMADGTEIGTHHADTPMTLQPVEGGLRYRIDEERFEIAEGEVLFFGPGHARDIRALADTALLLTITGDAGEG